MSELPEGWVETTCGELGTWTSGGTPSRGQEAYYGGDIPWVKTGDLNDGLVDEPLEHITESGLTNSSAKLFPTGTLLLAMYGATIGRVGTLALEAATNQACAALLPRGTTKDLIPFLFHYLVGQREGLREIGQGGAQPNLSLTVIGRFPCVVPPLNEQRRIVDKIEALTARSRRAKAALDAVPPLLDKLRQSILAAAFRGDLTKDWRANNPNVEPASVLLERIRKERRHRWEETTLAALKAKGKPPKDDTWKTKYQEPDPVDTEGLPELPEGWAWASVEELITEDGLAYGILKPGASDPVGVPMVRIMDLKHDRIDTTSLFRVSPDLAEEFSRTRLEPGNVVLAVMATIGRCAVVPPELAGANVNRALAVLRLTEMYDAHLFCWGLRTPQFLQSFVAHRVGSAQQRINLGDLRTFPIPLPPRKEQEAIGTAIRSALSSASTVAQAHSDSHQRLRDIDSAILSKAFRGELVPQDPNDEPASVLLERIRAEREAQSTQPKTSKKRTTKKRSKS